MIQLFPWLIAISFIISCTSHKNETDDGLTTVHVNTETSYICTPLKANKEDLIHFFNIKKNVDSISQLNFFQNDDSLIIFDENKSKWIEPIRNISIEERELQYSKIVKKKNFSVLFLVNPAESSAALFYKQNEKKVDRMIEDRHNDSVMFYQLNDTLLVCQYYCEYDLGSNLNDIRTYYFIGEKTGFFKYGCSTVGEELRFADFVINDEEISSKVKENDARILITPDTLIQMGTKRSKIEFKPYYVYFEKVVFSETH